MGSQKPTIVLVPGAWHYPECYDLLVERLHQHEYETRNVKLKSVVAPGEHRAESHHEDANALKDVIQPLIEQGREVIVLGHSYGGVVVSEGSSGLGKQRNKTGGVVHIIYCCAWVLGEGVSLGGFVQDAFVQTPELAAGMPQHFHTTEEDGLILRVIKEHAAGTFYNDVEPELAEKTIDKLGLHCSQTFMTPQVGCAYREIPSTYILCQQDKAIFPFVQQHMANQAGIKDVVKLNTSHSPFLSKPDEVFEIIDRIAHSTEPMQV